MNPISHHLIALTGYCLCDFTLVMREYQVHAAAVNVEMSAQIFSAHGCAFAVPPWEAIAPRGWPAHDMFRLGRLPQGKVGLIPFLTHACEVSAGIFHILKTSARENAVLMHLVVFLHIKVDGAIALISKAIVENLLHQLLLFDDVSCGMRLNARGQTIESLHCFMKTIGVILSHLHRFQLLQPRLLGYFVFALIGIMLQVPDISDVAHITHLISNMLEETENYIESDCWTSMSKMSVTIYCRSANIHAHVWRMQWAEHLFFSGQGVVNVKCLFH